MNVLSLFDGISCARLAMDRAGLPVTRYFAAEIDPYAIKVAQTNYPDTIQLGNVCNVHVTNLGIEVGHNREMKVYGSIPDVIFAGSPCQGFSKMGKGFNFEDDRSRLFFEFVRILEQCKKVNPKVKFLLENVDMVVEWANVISRKVGVTPAIINSALVSAQSRSRLYWCNFKVKYDMFGNMLSDIPQPKDRGIVLADILEKEVDEKFFLSDAAVKRLKIRHENFRPKINPDKSGALLSGNQSGKNTDQGTTYIVHHGMPRTGGKKHGGTGPLSRNDGKVYSLDTTPTTNKIELIPGTIDFDEFIPTDDKSYNIDANYFKGHDNRGQRTVIMQRGRGKNKGNAHEKKSPTVTSGRFEQNHSVIQINQSKESNGVQPYQQNRVYDPSGKSPALLTEMSSGSHAIEISPRIRRLTPVECERLQGIPDNYTLAISNTQRYKCLGNGWQIDTIVHILSFFDK